MNALRQTGPATLLLGAIALIVVLAGAVAVITGNYDDDFRQWVNDLVQLAIGTGLLGVGRGILKGKAVEAEAKLLAPTNVERMATDSAKHTGLGDD